MHFIVIDEPSSGKSYSSHPCKKDFSERGEESKILIEVKEEIIIIPKSNQDNDRKRNQ